MTTTPNLLAKIDARLSSRRASPAAESSGEQSVHRPLQDALSGALRERCSVVVTSGTILASVPASALVSNGVRIAENAIAGGPSILTGTVRAVANAERRIAKMLGKGWDTRLRSYDPAKQTAVFEVIRADTPT